MVDTYEKFMRALEEAEVQLREAMEYDELEEFHPAARLAFNSMLLQLDIVREVEWPAAKQRL